MTRALVFVPGRGAAAGEVDVYRYGEEVVCVAKVTFTRKALVGAGHVQAEVAAVVCFSSFAAFDAEKARAFERHPEKYALAVGAFKSLDDDARYAPELPEELREAVDRMRGRASRTLAAAEDPRGPAVRLLSSGDEDRDGTIEKTEDYLEENLVRAAGVRR